MPCSISLCWADSIFQPTRLGSLFHQRPTQSHTRPQCCQGIFSDCLSNAEGLRPPLHFSLPESKSIIREPPLWTFLRPPLATNASVTICIRLSAISDFLHSARVSPLRCRNPFRERESLWWILVFTSLLPDFGGLIHITASVLIRTVAQLKTGH